MTLNNNNFDENNIDVKKRSSSSYKKGSPREKKNLFEDISLDLNELLKEISEEVTVAINEALSELTINLSDISGKKAVVLDDDIHLKRKSSFKRSGSINVGVINTNEPVRVSGSLRADEIKTSEDIRVSGSMRVDGDVECGGCYVSGSGRINGNLLVNGELIVSGSLRVAGDTVTTGPIKISGSALLGGDIKTTGELFKVSGSVRTGGEMLSSNSIKISGGLKTVKLVGNEIIISGKISVDEIVGKYVSIRSGNSIIGTIEGENIELLAKESVSPEIGGLIGNLLKSLLGEQVLKEYSRENNEIIVEDWVKGEDVYIEGFNILGDIYGRNVVIGPNTIVEGTIYYIEHIDIDPDAEIGNIQKINNFKKKTP